MEIVRRRTWSTFKRWLKGYFDSSSERQSQFLFRGQTKADWPLVTTLDRAFRFLDDHEREKVVDDLINEFKKELLHVGAFSESQLEAPSIELLARHQGLPSPFLDWTESPYVASFFAFSNCSRVDRKPVAIWMLDRAKLPETAHRVEIIDDHQLLRYNARAVRQRGVFLRSNTIEPVDKVLRNALVKIELPASESVAALTELDAMTINATYLFADMEYAASTAKMRIDRRRQEQ